MSKYQGSQASKDPREVKDLVPAKPVPPTFASRAEYEGFQIPIINAFHAGILPDSVQTEQAAITIALKGRELGLEPMYALSVIYLIKGKPALEGEAMLALVLRRYPETKIKWVEATHSKAVLELSRPNSEPSRFTFTIQDALRAGLITKINPDGTVVAAGGKQVWSQYTRKMLCWRVISEAVTLLFPECIQGCLMPEELQPPKGGPVEKAIDVKELDAAFAPATKTVEAIEAPVVSGTEIHEKEPPEPPKLNEAELLPFEKPELSIQDGGTMGETLVPATQIAPSEVMPAAANGPDYTFQVGQYFGRKLSSIPEPELRAYKLQLEKRIAVKGRDAKIQEMLEAIKAKLG